MSTIFPLPSQHSTNILHRSFTRVSHLKKIPVLVVTVGQFSTSRQIFVLHDSIKITQIYFRITHSKEQLNENMFKIFIVHNYGFKNIIDLSNVFN
jgi:hypothetical protein